MRCQGHRAGAGVGLGEGSQHRDGVGETPSLPGLQRGWEWGWGVQFWSQGKVKEEDKNKTHREVGQGELEESFSKGDPDVPSLSLAQSYYGRISSKILDPLTLWQPFPPLFCSPYLLCFHPFLIGQGQGVPLLRALGGGPSGQHPAEIAGPGWQVRAAGASEGAPGVHACGRPTLPQAPLH